MTYFTPGVGNSGYGTQLALPDDFIRAFTNTFTRLPVYRPDGSKAPKYRPVRYDDWMREQTKPWKRPRNQDLAKLLAKYGDQFEYEEIEDTIVDQPQ